MALPLETYMPYDSGPGANVTEDGWRQFAQFFRGDGVIRGELSEFKPFGDSTGMQTKVPAGRCWIKGQFGQNLTQYVAAHPASDPTLGRRDIVILRNDFTANRIEIDVLVGTPASTPLYPVLTQNTSRWEIQLARVTVDPGVVTIAANKVDARQQFVDGSCEFGLDGSFQAIANNLITRVDWDIEQFSSSAVAQSGTNGINGFTFSRSGSWLFVGSLEWAANKGVGRTNGAATTGSRQVWVNKTSGGDDRHGMANLAPNVSGWPTVTPFNGLLRVVAGDEYAVYAYQDCGDFLEITRGNGGSANYNTSRVAFYWLGP